MTRNLTLVLTLSILLMNVTRSSSQAISQEALQGHWIQLPENPHEILECPDELRFTSKNQFSILNECYSGEGIEQVAAGEYQLDGHYLVLKNIMFTSRARPYFTREFGRIELEIKQDTLEVRVYREKADIERYLRL